MHSLLFLLVLPMNDAGPKAKAPPRPDVVLRWNEVALDAIRAEKTPPPLAARHRVAGCSLARHQRSCLRTPEDRDDRAEFPVA